MISRTAMEADVAQEKHAAKFNSAVESNTRVIRSRMADGYRHSFALYDGGDSAAMVALLRGRGFDAKVAGGVWCKL